MYFPKEIWKNIFEFDPTYHETYLLLQQEFFLKTRYWKMKWLNHGTDHYGLIQEQEKFNPNDFRAHQNNIIYMILRVKIFTNLGKFKKKSLLYI